MLQEHVVSQLRKHTISPVMPHEEELDQVSKSGPEEESEEELVGDAERANSGVDSGENVRYSIAYGEDTSSEEVQPPTPSPPRLPSPAPLRIDWVNFMGSARCRTALKTILPPKKRALSSTDTEPLPKRQCLSNQLEIGESSQQVRPREVGPTEPTIPPNTARSKPQPDPEAQLSESSNEGSDAVMEALDDRLVQIQGVVDLADSVLGRLHGRVAMGETRLTAVEHEVIAAEQRNERAGERMNLFATLTVVNTMLLVFVLLRGWFS
ncbi:hypothetical protein L1987_43264 [Smallanthus sonchifolius]|uniref:Uncharacterized protein n=1 Tax=Smallanthus sonchifolius TaxID=185202 RepID=A0ACB9GL36_9ASTR|nr:hypothetical protein L1987_43264 [Smallanthus sonchifolius]